MDYIGRMLEGSKVQVLDSCHFEGLGSNPTPIVIHRDKWTISSARKQFENNRQHTLNFIDYIGRIAEWSKVLFSGTCHVEVVG